MKRVLLTGMSGTGKSSLVVELKARGYKAVDTDDGWTEPLPDGRQRWREDAIQSLLATEDADVLFIAGCEENQGKFVDQFDYIILLSAPLETLVERLKTRTNNPYGKSPAEFKRFLDDVHDVEPQLRGIATHEIGTTMPLNEVVDAVLRIVKPSVSDPRAACGVRPLRMADAEPLSAAFAAIGWSKPAELFIRYASEADAGNRTCWVAIVDGELAGYVTLRWVPDYPGIAGRGIPEIQDLNVLPRFRRRGIATAMLEIAEAEAARRSDVVAIGVGLHPGYNAAQVLYVKRGYIPDGLGVTYGDRFVQEGETLPFDDSLVLHFTKRLAT